MDERRYVEPARSYRSVGIVLALFVGGFLIDLLALGGGRVHALAWLGAAVIVSGFDFLITYAARGLRSIVVTDDEVRVGETALPRRDIVGLTAPVDGLPVLGRRPGEPLPRGTSGVTLELADGRSVMVASRRPERLAGALGAVVGPPVVRPAAPEELPLIPDIDERAEALFRVAGLDLPDLRLDVEDLRASKAVLVVGRPPVGFVQLDEVDGCAHIEEISVLPGEMRRGLGTLLLEAAYEWAREQGYPAITLTTYAEVSWNGPFYAARGFQALEELSPGLAAVRERERRIGLDEVGPRIAMRRAL